MWKSSCDFQSFVWGRQGQRVWPLLHLGWLFNFWNQPHAAVWIAEVLQTVSLSSSEYYKEDRKSALVCVLFLRSCLFVYVCLGWKDWRTQSWNICVLLLSIKCFQGLPGRVCLFLLLFFLFTLVVLGFLLFVFFSFFEQKEMIRCFQCKWLVSEVCVSFACANKAEAGWAWVAPFRDLRQMTTSCSRHHMFWGLAFLCASFLSLVTNFTI